MTGFLDPTHLIDTFGAATGGRSTLWVHVPGALVLTVGTGCVTAWAFSGAARRAVDPARSA